MKNRWLMPAMIIALMALIGLCRGAVWAQSRDKVCPEHERGQKYSLCQTYTKSGIQVVCSQYAVKGAPPTAGLPVLSYSCKTEGEGATQTLVCTGGWSLPHTTVKTLAHDEFVDTNKRCSTLCDECSKGWEASQ